MFHCSTVQTVHAYPCWRVVNCSACRSRLVELISAFEGLRAWCMRGLVGDKTLSVWRQLRSTGYREFAAVSKLNNR